MFELIKNIIKSKDYKLEEMLNKINILWIKGDLSEEQKDELLNLARENALAENSYRPLEERVNQLFKLVEELAAKVNALENKDVETEDATIVEYPEYVQPIGSHDAYQVGDKITYNGKKYTCIFAGCVWNPEQYPQGWKEVKE